MKTLRNLLDEELKIVKKNWNLSSKKYTVEINDNITHSILDRILDRTNTTINDFKCKGIKWKLS